MVMDGGASSDLLIEGTLPEAAPPGGTPSVQSFQDVIDGGGMRHIPLPAVIGLLSRDVGRDKGVEGYSGK
jgi:hypothetical protein